MLSALRRALPLTTPFCARKRLAPAISGGRKALNQSAGLMLLQVTHLRSRGVCDLAPIDPRFTFKSFALLLNAGAAEQGAEICGGADGDR